jgi:hypothetical protein
MTTKKQKPVKSPGAEMRADAAPVKVADEPADAGLLRALDATRTKRRTGKPQAPVKFGERENH